MTECRIFHFRFLLLALVLGSGLIFASCNKSTEKHVARGEEYLQKRRFEEAVMEFRTAADIDKTSAKAHWGLARAYENLGQFYESIDALRQVTNSMPTISKLKSNSATIFCSPIRRKFPKPKVF
jgi:Tfp pilus assembly protein PilF